MQKFSIRFKAIVFYLIALCILRWQAISLINTHVLGGVTGDAGIYTYLAQIVPVNIFHSWFNLNTFYPYSYTLAWSDCFIFPAFLIQLINLSGLSFIVSYNLVLLLAQFLNAYFSYEYFYKVSNNYLSSLVAGLGILACNFLLAHLGHPQLQFFFFIPLSLLLVELGLKSNSGKYFFLAGITNTLCFLSSSYYGIFGGILIGLRVLLSLQSIKKQLKTVFFLTLGMLPCLPFILSYLKVQAAFGTRYLHEPQAFSANLLSFITPAQNSVLAYLIPNLSHSEAQLYLGIFAVLGVALALIKSLNKYLVFVFLVTLLLSLTKGTLAIATGIASIATMSLCLYKYYKNRNLNLLFLSFFCFTLFIALGPLGINKNADFSISIQHLLFEIIPGFSALRAISRIGLISIFFAYLLFALNYKINLKSFFLACAIIVLEGYPRTLPLEQFANPPMALSEVKSSSPGAVALMLPFADKLDSKKQILSWQQFANLNTKYMNYVADAGITLFNGYSGQRSNIMEQLPGKLSSFPDLKAFEYLKQFPALNYIISEDIPTCQSTIYPASQIFADGSCYWRITNTYLMDSFIIIPSIQSKLEIYSDEACDLIFSLEDNFEKAIEQKYSIASGINQLNLAKLNYRVAPYKFKLRGSCKLGIKIAPLD